MGIEADLERSGVEEARLGRVSGDWYPAMLSSSLNSVISGVLCAERCMRMITPKLNLQPEEYKMVIALTFIKNERS